MIGIPVGFSAVIVGTCEGISDGGCVESPVGNPVVVVEKLVGESVGGSMSRARSMNVRSIVTDPSPCANLIGL